MVEIIPAILPKSYEELEEKVDLVSGHASVVQIDICDGGYVPSRTWPYLKGVDTIFEDIASQEKALPHWEKLDFEFDLMVKGVHEKIPDFISAGASRIVVHKASVNPMELEDIIKDFGKKSEELGPFDIELGLALMPSDDPLSIRNLVPGLHFVQVMGIEKIGFQGQDASPRAIGLVKALRKEYPGLVISVDGGVSAENAKKFAEAGADRLVVGSALWGSEDFLGTLEMLRSI